MATYTTLPAFTAGQVLKANGDGATYAGMNDLKNNLDLANAQSQAFARNLLYNGAMQVSQRQTSVPNITGGGYYTADRWYDSLNLVGTWTQSVENDAPAGTGLRKSLKMLCTTAAASPTGAGYHVIEQRLEGFDVQRIAKGTAAAQTLTLSFWVKSNVTGTYVVELLDNDNARVISKTYTIVGTGTWEQETITFPADTTGALDNDNLQSLSVGFWLGAGTDYTSGTLNTSTWAARVNTNRAVGGRNVASAVSNYWQVTGVQLETGSVSTPYEFLPFTDDLRRCQRYYEKSYDPTVVPGTNTAVGAFFATITSHADGTAAITVPFKVSKSRVPDMLGWSAGGTANNFTYSRSGVAATNAGASFGQQGIGSTLAFCQTSATWVAATIQGHWTASAELL